MADAPTFSIWLKKERENKGWSQSDLAREAQVTRAAINGIETGARGPGVELCLALAKAFHIPPEDLFRAAGLLPPSVDKGHRVRRIELIASELPPDEQENAIDYLLHRLQVAEKKGTYAPRKKTPRDKKPPRASRRPPAP